MLLSLPSRTDSIFSSGRSPTGETVHGWSGIVARFGLPARWGAQDLGGAPFGVQLGYAAGEGEPWIRRSENP
ncbi:MAG: hypothetical protein ACI9U2_004407 [Bradymonadia bacterium]|jgi:hypothetical protein